MDNYQNTITINAGADVIYQALTTGISQWWSTQFEGSSNKQGDAFTVKFGDNIYKVFLVEELSPSTHVVWLVTNSLIDIPELKNKTEWINTRIEWTILAGEAETTLQLTHVGLTPEIECYDICRAGWTQFLASLKAFSETGSGMPFRA